VLEFIKVWLKRDAASNPFLAIASAFKNKIDGYRDLFLGPFSLNINCGFSNPAHIYCERRPTNEQI
jgi:hypothetical protein